MMIRWKRFNIYLFVALAVVLACGCQTAESLRKKQLATLHLHIQAPPDPAGMTQQIPVYREHPMMLRVSREPFLTEANVKEAKVLDAVGGFVLSIQFDRQGTWLLEQYTGANLGRHLAIFSQFVMPPEEKLNAGRWLAAPKINTRIGDGLLVFTPDATRQEAEQIALGLNNVARKLGTAKATNW